MKVEFFKSIEAAAKQSGAMEQRPFQKRGSLKSHTSRENARIVVK